MYRMEKKGRATATCSSKKRENVAGKEVRGSEGSETKADKTEQGSRSKRVCRRQEQEKERQKGKGGCWQSVTLDDATVLDWGQMKIC